MASATDTVRPERPKAPRARSTQRLDDLVGESPLRVRSPESSVARRRGHVKWLHVFPSRLTTRLLAVNLLALAIVAGGVFYLDQYERGLTEERISAMVTQADIVAAALGETAVPHDPMLPQAMDPALGRKLLQRLATPLQTRARLYDQDGRLVADSRRLAAGGTQVRWYELGPPRSPGLLDSLFDDLKAYLDQWRRAGLPLYSELPTRNGHLYPEVYRALLGEGAAFERVTLDGQKILSVAVPVQRFKQVVGALLLTSGTEIIEIRVRQVREAILQLSLLAFGITVLLSFYLASTVARPIRRLAESAELVAGGRGRSAGIPDLSARQDEIGDLSVSLGRMTSALYQRIDAIEGFAADVAHEIKNPLSSMRSAADTISRVNDPQAREELLAILREDIKRMDRLISDISAASRIDAELLRAETAPVDLSALLSTLVDIHVSTAKPGAPRMELVTALSEPIVVQGIEDRLVQVFRNLIENAISFSPPGGLITVSLGRRPDSVVISVEDEGPGLPPGKTEAIFDRFYSERPAGEKFGTHSGLGLSISKQIVDAHGGIISATNRGDGQSGARFTIRLPI